VNTAGFSEHRRGNPSIFFLRAHAATPARIVLILLLLPPTIAAVMGWLVAPSFFIRCADLT
jgi:hypothetical protein